MGQCDGHAHCQSHPKQAEVEAIQRVIYFVQETGVTTLIPHVSTAEGLALISLSQNQRFRYMQKLCTVSDLHRRRCTGDGTVPKIYACQYILRKTEKVCWI